MNDDPHWSLLRGQPPWLLAAEITSLACTALAIAKSFQLIQQHRRQNKHASLRKVTIRILLMVPLYALSASASLWLFQVPLVSEGLEVLRTLYESVVIFSFVQLVIICCGGVTYLLARFEVLPTQQGQCDDGECPPVASSFVQTTDGMASPEALALPRPLGDSDSDASTIPSSWPQGATDVSTLRALTSLLEPGESGPNEDSSESDSVESRRSSYDECEVATPSLRRPAKQFPILERCLPAWRSPEQMLRWCITGALTYVVVSCFNGVLKAVAFTVVEYGSPGAQDIANNFVLSSASPLRLVVGLFQFVAMTSLLVLAVNVMEDLKPIRPEAKFLSVKSIVFFTVWQGFVLHVLGDHHIARWRILDSLSGWEGFGCSCERDMQVAVIIQSLLVCLEMCILSFVHPWVFPPNDYETVLVNQHAFHEHAGAVCRLETPNPSRRGGRVINVGDIFRDSRSMRSEAALYGASSSG
ncbi:unnamed protein product [Prorocentrum cordatum]|uniref:Transmembrane protein 184C n=1 Tax=Prorocentrum cordatum TaxID=2364126 RepID=A0ABN9V2B3_9DINO|nr:unnamed protein product [Polarella glacialis]